MIKRFLLGLTVLCATSFTASSFAQGAPSAAGAGTTDAKSKAVQKLFEQRFDNPSITAVRPTPYGLYEVQLGPDLVYTDEKVTFVFDGTLIDAKRVRTIRESVWTRFHACPLISCPSSWR